MDFIARIESNWLVLLIPLIAGLVGWGTNVLALRMSFYPVDFVGIPPYLGWRGVIPSNAEKLSQSMIQLLTEKLLDVKELFSGSGQDLDKDLDPLVERITKQVVEQISTEIAPEKWARSHQALRDYMIEMIEKSSRKVVLSILADFKENADQVIDLESVVIDAIRKDAGLLGHVFTEVAGPELKFIERSGFWFGLLFDLVETRIGIVFEEYKRDPMTAMLMPPERIMQAKEELLEQMRTNKPEPDGLIRSFVDKAVALRGQLSSKLQALDAQSFEGVLRPAFQEDEWKLFVTGAVLGTVAGILQLVYLFGGSLG